MTKRAPTRGIGFALGGLGGSNAHGVGFLEAARREGLSPAILSCTSGMIHWTARWLAGDALRVKLAEQIQRMPRLPEPFAPLSSMLLMARGVPGVFRPAWWENWASSLSPFSPLDRNAMFDRLFPARMVVPTLEPEFFQETAHILENAPMGVIFNSYAPARGVEYLHANPAAMTLLGKTWDREEHGRVFRPITPEYVQAALWLLQYGFAKDFDGETLIDGAYHRQFIVRELTCVDTLFIARPQSRTWRGALPTNLFEVEDFKTELLFNSSYAGEISTLRTINDWIAAGRLGSEGVHPIELVEIEIETQRGFFDYFFESLEVFDHALAQSSAAIRAWKDRST